MKKQHLVLHIDTAESKKISVVLEIDGKRYQKVSRSKIDKAQAILPLIDSLLKERKTELKDINEIRVNLGPGSFTGLRVGVAVANSLGWSLGIPVNGQLGKFVVPVYYGTNAFWLQ